LVRIAWAIRHLAPKHLIDFLKQGLAVLGHVHDLREFLQSELERGLDFLWVEVTLGFVVFEGKALLNDSLSHSLYLLVSDLASGLVSAQNLPLFLHVHTVLSRL